MMSNSMVGNSMGCNYNSMMCYSNTMMTQVTKARFSVAISLFVIEVGVNGSIAIGLVSSWVPLMAVTVICPKPMDINSGAPSWCVHLSSITISIVLALCPI